MLWLLLICLLLFIYMPFAMRSWRALITLSFVYLIVEIGVRLGVANYSAADVPRLLVSVGNAWIDLFVKVLPVTVIARAAVLMAKSLGLRGRGLLAANIIGILALPGGIAGIAAHRQWERRAAPLECTSRQIPLVLSGVTATATWSKSVVLHVGKDIRDSRRYLFSPSHRRRICRDTSNGTESLLIEAISVGTRHFSLSSCTMQNITPWELSVCENWKGEDWYRKPHEVVIFNPAGIRPGYFGIPNSPTNTGFKLGDNERLVTATNKKHAKITAVCRVPTKPDRPLYCEMQRPIAEGISLYWEANLLQGKTEEYLLRSDDFATSVCVDLFGQALCDTPYVARP